MNRTLVSPLLAAAFACSMLPSQALAQASGYSADSQLVRPNFSADGLISVDSPEIVEPGTFRVGALVQYENAPVRLIEFDRVQGAVVQHRHTLQLGFSYSPTARISTRLVLPVVAQWGGQIDDLRGDGFGMGDVSAGVRWKAGKWNRFGAGFYGDLYVPIGTRDQYMGETRPRLEFGSLMSLDFSQITFFANAGVMLRTPIPTDEDFTLGQELSLKLGGRYEVWDDRLYAFGEVITRLGFSRFLTGGGENSMEWNAGVRLAASKSIQLDLGVGRGITEGFGTSSLRVMTGLSYVRVPKPEPIEEDLDLAWTDIPDDEPEVEVPPPPVEPPPKPPEWRPTERARQVGDQIEIRDPIQFELNTDRILPESLPTLAAVAKILNTKAQIGHIVIEGHASAEGSFIHNYELSMSRAIAIFEQLLRNGVHPSRMSVRSMGEVVPKKVGTEEAILAENRRVEFHIVRQLGLYEKYPNYERVVRRPWDGDEQAILQPPRPERPTKRLENTNSPAPSESDTTPVPQPRPLRTIPLDADPDLAPESFAPAPVATPEEAPEATDETTPEWAPHSEPDASAPDSAPATPEPAPATPEPTPEPATPAPTTPEAAPATPEPAPATPDSEDDAPRWGAWKEDADAPAKPTPDTPEEPSP